MKSLIRIVACLAMAVAASSCINLTTEVYVKKDGSAMITQQMYMTPQALGMMAQQGGGKAPPLIDEAKLKAAAADMGKGVTFTGVEALTRKDGSKGYVARYAIANVNDLAISETLTAPGAGQSLGGGAPAPKKTEALKFKFTPGDEASLMIAIPQSKNDASTSAGTKENDPQAAAMMQQMKPMFEGMRMWVRVRVEGTISETNARYVNPKKTGLTLSKIDFGKLMADEKGFAKLQALGQNPSPNQMRTALKGLPYIQADEQKIIKIKFK